MDDTDDNDKGALASEFGGGEADAGVALGKDSGVLFGPEEFDIYVNRVTLDGYIFHGQAFGDAFERLDFDWADNSVMVYRRDGTSIDLGSKIQWLIRPYFKKLQEISIVQTKNGESVEGFIVPIRHLNKTE